MGKVELDRVQAGEVFAQLGARPRQARPHSCGSQTKRSRDLLARELAPCVKEQDLAMPIGEASESLGERRGQLPGECHLLDGGAGAILGALRTGCELQKLALALPVAAKQDRGNTEQPGPHRSARGLEGSPATIRNRKGIRRKFVCQIPPNPAGQEAVYEPEVLLEGTLKQEGLGPRMRGHGDVTRHICLQRLLHTCSSRPVPQTLRRSSKAKSCGIASVRLVRVATWNVNSVKQRLPRLLPWLDERQPDVVCLQETKLTDGVFDQLLGDELTGRGYAFARHGEAQWNGVAIFSRMGLDDVAIGVGDVPGLALAEARAVSATCGGVRVHSVYVPNGRVPDSDHYRYKLAWLAALQETVDAGPEAGMVCGDMNIAPADIDVFDPDAYIGQTHVTAPERAALAKLQELGLHDVVRDRWPTERVFTYWDYRAGMFHQDLGMRIDLVLATPTVANRVRAAWVDRQARKGTKPSDHAPVIVDLDEAPDGDIGPVVPPPSSSAAKRGSAKLPQAPGSG